MFWKSTKIKPKLKEGQIHLWRINISQLKPSIEKYWNILTEDEKIKAKKFRFKKDFNCSVIARGVLRELLGLYLNEAPNRLIFNYSSYKKPILEHPNLIKFNVSHSNNSIIIAITKSTEVGVDVEFIKSNMEFDDIAASFFSNKEIQQLNTLNKKNRAIGFFNCWTRKEAFIKAEGSGLSFPLNKFSVSLKPNSKVELLETKWDFNEKKLWTLKSFNPYPDYIGAVAVKSKIDDIQFFNYL